VAKPGASFSTLPEVFVVVFSLLLNLAWEMWQVPFYEGMAEARHWDGIRICTQATLGDAVISLAAFAAVAWWAGSRNWLIAPRKRELALYLAVGLAVTVVLEALATGPLDRWSYGDDMPRLPWLGTGVLPILQWLLLPLPILWLARNQVLGAKAPAYRD
jgi:hypothetical protein